MRRSADNRSVKCTTQKTFPGESSSCCLAGSLRSDCPMRNGAIVNRREDYFPQKYEGGILKQKRQISKRTNTDHHHYKMPNRFKSHYILFSFLAHLMSFTLASSLEPSRADLFIAHMVIYFRKTNNVLDFQNQPVVFDRTKESIDSLQTIDWFDTGLTTHQLFDMIWHKSKNVDEKDIRLFIGKRECLMSSANLTRNGTESQLTRTRYKKAFVKPQDVFASINDQQKMELTEIQDGQFEIAGEVPDEIDKEMGAELMETWEHCDQEAYEILKPWSTGTLETRAFATDAEKPLAASSVGQIHKRRLMELTEQFPKKNFRDKVCHAATTWKLEGIYLSEDRITLEKTESGGQELLIHGIGNPRLTDIAVEANDQTITDMVTALEISGKEGFMEETGSCGRDTITNIVGYGILIAVAAYGAQTALMKQILANDKSWRDLSSLRKCSSVQGFLEERLRSTRRLQLKMLVYFTVTTLAASIPLFLAIRGELCYLSVNVQEGRHITLDSGNLEHFKRLIPEVNGPAGGENCRPIIDSKKKLPGSQGRCDKETCVKHSKWHAVTNFFVIMSTRPHGSNIVLIATVVLGAAALTGFICYTQLRIGPADNWILTLPRWFWEGRAKTQHYVLMVALPESEECCRIIGSF